MVVVVRWAVWWFAAVCGLLDSRGRPRFLDRVGAGLTPAPPTPRRCHPAPGRCCALAGGPRASPLDPPNQAPHGVGCDQHNGREHERPSARLRVRPFPATTTTPA